MKKILAFAGSTSTKSINKQLVTYAASLVEHSSTQVVDLNEYPLPIYSTDLEEKEGIPENARKFKELLDQNDGYMLSLAEHNGSYASAFKNLYDWVSRIEGKVWGDKPLMLLSTSPGARGGQSVMEAALSRFPFMGAEIAGHFSLPSFYDNFSENEIKDSKLGSNLKQEVMKLEQALT